MDRFEKMTETKFLDSKSYNFQEQFYQGFMELSVDH